MDAETYPTRTAAKTALAGLRGWPAARVVRITGEDGQPVLAIEAAPGRYLRRDGYVR